MIKISRSPWQNPYYKLAVVLLCIVAMGMLNVKDYGISPDEQLHIFYPLWLRQFLTDGQPIPLDIQYYGAAFDGFSEAIFQIYRSFQLFFSDTSFASHGDTSLFSYFSDRVILKHYLNFLLSTIAYISVAGLCSILIGIEYAWFSPIVLALFPRFWGHSFFNPKDIPFAALFSLSTWVGCYLVDRYIKQTSGRPIDPRKTAIFSIASGIVFGLLTGIRPGGCVILIFVAIAYLAIAIPQKIDLLSSLRKLARFYLLLFGSWSITTILSYPKSWFYPLSPFLWFLKAVQYHASHPWSGNILFNGEVVQATNLPWHYIPTWFFISTPLIFQVLFCVGFACSLWRYQQFSTRQKICILLVSLQVFALPFIAIVKQSTLFDGIRHLLFVLPGTSIFVVFGCVFIYQRTQNQILKRVEIGAIAIVLSAIAVNMVQLHPYQYTYFNPISDRALSASDRYETDYWGLSMREGIEWIGDRSPSPTMVVVSVPWLVAQVRFFANPHLTIVSKNNFTNAPTSSYYYLARPRGKETEDFPNCPVVHSVTRTVPLAIVKQCPFP